jgi:hypothetical protein
MVKESTEVWVFHGAGAQFASGVFASRADAESWIARNQLTGLLTAYPVGVGVYDWAVDSGEFKVTKDKHRHPQFIGSFTSGAQEHFHYENGREQ